MLPDPTMMTDDLLVDMMGMLREVARGEEERRVDCEGQGGRRGCRFLHYYKSLDIHLNKEVMDVLCNSLCED